MVRLNFKVSNVYMAENLADDLDQLLNAYNRDKVFVLTDDNSFRYCYPRIAGVKGIDAARTIVIESGDDHKHIEAVAKVWKALSNGGADRKSVLINLGGGMPTDLGGFAAATFKRGIRFINIPTTLLSQVDASVGGKTGINFEGFKNEIGVFQQADAVLVDTQFFETLDSDNLVSGFAEMIKHTLIYTSQGWNDLKSFDILNPDFVRLKQLVAESISIKDFFVEADPREQGIRKALNFGHTLGHAIESFALKAGSPMLHGHAVAYGMIGELYLSVTKLGFPRAEADAISAEISRVYGHFPVLAEHNDVIFEWTRHDKKNEDDRINFSLLKAIGQVEVNVNCSKADILDAMDYYRSFNK
ncbi:MAG: 3-dehydroquinate synthase [Marinilabiliaceae bacterium]|nr:3-dehydroquinate synthase [Marinilabiliaceae bacterium]